MRARECRKHELACIGRAVIDLHSGHSLVKLGDSGHIREIKLGIDALSEHIERERYYISVTGSFTVAEECSLNSVSACKKSHLGVCHGASSVVVGVERNDDVLSVFEIVIHILYLICVNVRHRYLNGHGKIYNHLFVSRRLPYVKNCVAYLKREFRLCARKGLGRIFVAIIYSHFLAILIKKLCAAYRDVNDLLLGFLEHLLALCYRGGIVKMNYRVLSTLEALKGLFDNMLS